MATFKRLGLLERIWIAVWPPAKRRYKEKLYAEIKRLVVDAPNEPVDFI